MKIEEMNLAEVIARMAELEEEVRSLTDAEEAEKRAEEMKELQTRKAELEDAEKRAQAAKDLENGQAKPSEIIERGGNKTMENTFTTASKEFRDAWVHKLQRVQLSEIEERAIAQAGIQGAIPDEVTNVFFEKMKKLAPMLSEITLFKVAGNLKFVAEGDRPAAAKHTEGQAISAAANTYVTVSLGAYEFAKIIEISKSAQAMATDAFIAWISDMLAGDIARAIDDYILNDSTNGLTENTYIEATMINSTMYKYTDFTNLIAALPAAYDAEAKFLMNKRTLYTQVAGVLDGNKRPIFVTDPATGVGKIMGYDVVLDDYITSGKAPVYLGKYTDIVGNLSIPVEVESSEAAGFNNGTIVYRGFAAFDSKLAKTDAIVKMGLSNA